MRPRSHMVLETPSQNSLELQIHNIQHHVAINILNQCFYVKKALFYLFNFSKKSNELIRANKINI